MKKLFSTDILIQMLYNFTDEETSVVYTEDEFNMHEYFFLIFSAVFIMVMLCVLFPYLVNHCVNKCCSVDNSREGDSKKVVATIKYQTIDYTEYLHKGWLRWCPVCTAAAHLQPCEDRLCGGWSQESGGLFRDQQSRIIRDGGNSNTREDCDVQKTSLPGASINNVIYLLVYITIIHKYLGGMSWHVNINVLVQHGCEQN